VAGSCECGNEPSGSIKYREVFLLTRRQNINFVKMTLLQEASECDTWLAITWFVGKRIYLFFMQNIKISIQVKGQKSPFLYLFLRNSFTASHNG
jgi:hypothetical protein